MGKCLNCASYFCVDEHHQFSKICDWSGFDGFCCRHFKFVLEEDSCSNYLALLEFNLIQDSRDFVCCLSIGGDE